MSNNPDIDGANDGQHSRTGTLLIAAFAILTFTSTAGIATITLNQVEKHPEEQLMEARNAPVEDSRGRADQ